MNRKYTTEKVKAILAEEGYKLLSDYEVYSKQIRVECPEGHRYAVYLGNFMKGHRCGVCKNNKAFTYTYVKDYFESRDYTLKSKTYRRAHDILSTICPVGHEYNVSFNSFKRGTRCSKCSSSKGEHLVREILKGILNKPFHEQYRIDNNNSKYYFDFFIEGTPPIFIEYDGIQHFESKELFGGDNNLLLIQQRDREKEKIARDMGGILVRVPYYLEDRDVYDLLYRELSKVTELNSSWSFKISEFNPRGYPYKDIADYYMTHTQKETAKKFGVSHAFPSSCFIKIYGESKKEYLRRKSNGGVL